MAYQNVGTPKFYIDSFGFLETINYPLDFNPSDLHRLLPVFVNNSPIGYITYYFPVTFLGNYSFIAVLGHSLHTNNVDYELVDPEANNIDLSNVVNGTTTSGYDGFSISTFNGTDQSYLYLIFGTGASPVGNIGSAIIGTYYEMPNAPDLSLTISREYDGTKTFTTDSGSSMSNTMWSKPPKWGDLGAWELGDSNPSLAKSGRRTWDLKFSYVDDGDLFGSNQMLSKTINTFTGLETSDYTVGWVEVAWTGDCFTPTANGYETFDEVSRTGFHAFHHQAPGGSTAGTAATINIISGVLYRVTFNLSLDLSSFPSGIAPDIDLKHSVGGQSITVEGAQRAIDGSNEFIFTANDTDTTSSLVFLHYYGEESSLFTVSDIFIETGTDITGIDEGFNYNLLTDINFFSQVWHKTLGGTLPFIFQPDSSNNNPDQFAICKFKDNSLKATQSAFNVYDISLSLEEVW
ncbi:hypothetical protein CMI37_36865 [Candidatus Pacearchaeota archaeon]|nr:hypothetical protein [Candidatus Pacearchaeota archaeon]|tara:strand:+ start:3878 stop:5260 length:1383 start_codon:yes stop_codon:yes gene_type:complete